MALTRRDLKFRLNPESVVGWHARGPYVTHFINAMSLIFPDGERYFIHTLRNHGGTITDLKLQAEVAAFIGQEAMHGREHEQYNRLLDEAGLPAAELQAHADRMFEVLKLVLSPAEQLSVTIGQEHLTAILADLVLRDPAFLAGADPRLLALWRWHALEETEHKAVAFEVYETVVGDDLKAYALRCAGLVFATVAFLSLTIRYQRRLLKADPRPRQRQGLLQFLDYGLGPSGVVPRLAGAWLAWFRPGFHPWQHDNRALLEELPALVSETQGFKLRAN